MNATELAGIILAAAGAAAAAVRLVDKLIELAESRRRQGSDYSVQQEASRAELLAELREVRGNLYQLRIEVREIAHRVLKGLGVPPERHELPDDHVHTQKAEGDQG